MSAWNQINRWSDAYYQGYRNYVKSNASKLKGSQEDCADLSMLLIINFAEQEALPLTFTDNQGILYSSNAGGQNPSSGMHIQYEKTDVMLPTGGITINSFGQPTWAYAPLELPSGIIYSGDNLTWKNKDEYYSAIKQRINAEALFNNNTEMNPFGPQSGDLLLSDSHAGLVIDSYPPGVPHPKAGDSSIKSWVDPATALQEVNVLEYFRDNHGMINDENKTKVHFDYLNHRGEKKPKAELIYFRRAMDAIADGFEFRKYKSGVLR